MVHLPANMRVWPPLSLLAPLTDSPCLFRSLQLHQRGQRRADGRATQRPPLLLAAGALSCPTPYTLCPPLVDIHVYVCVSVCAQSLLLVVVSGFGGGIVGPLLIGRPSMVTANDNIVAMAPPPLPPVLT